MIEALKSLSIRKYFQSPMADIDFEKIELSILKFLPTWYDGHVIFFLLPLVLIVPFTYGKGIDGLDEVYDGHA